MFSFQLAWAKRTGLREYGSLAEHHMREFEREGLRGGAPADEPFAGNERNDLWLAALVPSVPRALTITPLEQLPKLLFGMSSQRTSKGGGP